MNIKNGQWFGMSRQGRTDGKIEAELSPELRKQWQNSGAKQKQNYFP
jgi:hypothetical protein